MHRALRNAEINTLRRIAHEADVGVGSDAQVGPPDLDLCPSVGVSHHAVAGTKGKIYVGLAPVIAALELNGGGTGDPGDAAGLIGRVVILRDGGQGGQRHESYAQRQ